MDEQQLQELVRAELDRLAAKWEPPWQDAGPETRAGSEEKNMNGQITPRWIAETDQGLAEINSRLDALLAGVRSQAAEDGQAQATANLALMVTILSHDQLQETLYAALHRLAFRAEGGTPDA